MALASAVKNTFVVGAKFALQILHQDKKRLLGIAAIRNIVNAILSTNANLATVDRGNMPGTLLIMTSGWPQKTSRKCGQNTAHRRCVRYDLQTWGKTCGFTSVLHSRRNVCIIVINYSSSSALLYGALLHAPWARAIAPENFLPLWLFRGELLLSLGVGGVGGRL